MYKPSPPPRRHFLRAVMGLLGLATVVPLRRLFAQAPTPPPPARPRPAPPAKPPPAEPAPPVTPPPAFAAGGGPHVVTAVVTDGAGKAWRAQTRVGNDAAVAAVYVGLTDSAGNLHPGLTAWFYADCVEVGVCRFDCAYDYLNCKINVTYDGQAVALPPSSKPDGTVDFWRLCRSPAIRYGEQVRWDASKIDRSLLPSYTTDPQTPFDDSKMDYTFNGLGCASTPGMGQGGDRGDLGYMPQWNMPFILTPSDATWAVVRRAEDHCGVWGLVYICDPATGGIVDANKYPGTTTLPQAQVHAYKNNMLAPYRGSYDGDTLIPAVTRGNPGWSNAVTACKNVPNGSHLTCYAMLGAMITGTARDRDHASFWANWPLLEVNPATTQRVGTINTSQRRCAWTTRNLFLGSYISTDTTYFQGWLAKNLATVNAWPKNDFGLFDMSVTYPRKGRGVPDTQGYMGMSMWQQQYFDMVLDAIAHKLLEWMPFAQFLAKLEVVFANKPYTLMETMPYIICHDPRGNMMTDFDDMMHKSLVWGVTFTEDEASAVVNADSVEDAYNAVVTHDTRVGHVWNGKCVNGVADYHDYLGSPGAHAAEAIAASVFAYNTGIAGAGKSLAYSQGVPTKIDYRNNQKFHLAPRGA